jgi:nucleoside-diphosphate-sugar epimerase
MKNILLTGATGFLGSHLLEKLIKDYEVIITKRSFSKTWRIEDSLQDIMYYDIDKLKLEEIFEENKIDIIIHAATTYGRDGQEKISDVIKTNLLFPIELLELSDKFGTNYFINTDTFYNKGISLEGTLKSYITSKKHLLDYTRSFEKIKVINMRLEHIYGPKDSQKKFVPFVIKQLLSSDELDLTKGEQKRDYTYIEDVCEAYLAILKEITSIKHNFTNIEVGTGKSTTLKDFVLLIKELCESQTKLEFGKIPYRENEIMESRANTEILRSFNWAEKYSLKQGIVETINYFKYH